MFDFLPLTVETRIAARMDPVIIHLEESKLSQQHCLFISFYKINIISISAKKTVKSHNQLSLDLNIR